jgi:hypothetical protein
MIQVVGLYIGSKHVSVAVNIRLYEYGHGRVKIRKKMWNNEELKKWYWK